MKLPQLQTTAPFWGGIFLTPILHMVFLALSMYFFTKDYDFLIPVLFLAAFQFIYMLPLIAYAHFTKRPAFMQGLLMGACLTVLFQGSCWALFPVLVE